MFEYFILFYFIFVKKYLFLSNHYNLFNYSPNKFKEKNYKLIIQ